MEQGQLNWIANFIWGIAEDVLRVLYVRGKYRDVILPMTVLRRLDAVLEPTKQAVLDLKASLDAAQIVHQDPALRQAAGQAFYNTSKFTLRDLQARATQQKLRADFESYLDGFSPNVQDILENFEFRNQIPRLSKADALPLQPVPHGVLVTSSRTGLGLGALVAAVMAKLVPEADEPGLLDGAVPFLPRHLEALNRVMAGEPFDGGRLLQ
jgi:hypothetical protein